MLLFEFIVSLSWNSLSAIRIGCVYDDFAMVNQALWGFMIDNSSHLVRSVVLCLFGL